MKLPKEGTRQMIATLWTVLVLELAVQLPPADGFYLPGVAPRDFQTGETLEVKVNKLSSTKTQLPYDYYSLSYCRPPKIRNRVENLGEVLRGDRIENSVYSFSMREPQSCKIACRVELNRRSAKELKKKINDDYRVNMILDNLPVAVLWERLDGKGPKVYERGFQVGFKDTNSGSKHPRYYINNHLNFKVKYHPDPQGDSARVVGFEIAPLSVNHHYKKWDENNTKLLTCKPSSKTLLKPGMLLQEIEAGKEIIFTYDVSFESSDIRWASRWDNYLLMNDNQIHWFSIINSLMIVLFLSGMLAVIMLRTIYRDIANYNQLEQDGLPEETGWKLVHADVFRPPTNCSLLCVHVGIGVQVFGMAFVTMIFAVFGFLSPSNRGGLMTVMVFLWVFMGLFAGYSSGFLFKTLKGDKDWKTTSLQTALAFPSVLFTIFFILNALIWGQKSSGAVPFSTMFALVALWFGISLPLVFLGSLLGSKTPAPENPVQTNKIPRPIPLQPWYLHQSFTMLFGGILPFGAVFVELFFILTSVWLNQFYYIFGFLFLVFVILLVTCAEITIVLCYFQLCSEDYRWWWRAYLTSGASAVYLFVYSIFYFCTKLEISKLVSGILYFGYMFIIAYTFFILTGTIGFCACLLFIRRIYASVKID